MSQAATPAEAPSPPKNGRLLGTRAHVVLLAITLFAAVTNTLVSNPTPEDDAFIFFRYIDNFLRGGGLTWNRGAEHVEGYTSFLYLVILTIPRALGVDLLHAASVINGALFVATALAAALLARRMEGRWSEAVFFTPLLVASSGILGWLSRNGMESTLFGFLLVASIHGALGSAPRPRTAFFSGILFGLATLARPEGAMLYAICAVYLVIVNRLDGRPFVSALDGYRLAGFLALLLPHVLWRHSYYGDWLPNTYYAKMGSGTFAEIKIGFKAFLAFLWDHNGTLVALCVPLWVLAPPSRHGNLLAVLLAAWSGYLIWIGLDHWLYWYVAPLHLLSFLLAGSAIARLANAEPAAPRSTVRPIATIALSLLLIAFLIVPWIRPIDFLRAAPLTARAGQLAFALRLSMCLGVAALAAAEVLPRARVARLARHLPRVIVTLGLVHQIVFHVVLGPSTEPLSSFSAIADKLEEMVRPGDTLALSACGVIPYRTDLVTYDALGLNDRTIAHEPTPSVVYGRFGHRKGDGAYIFGKKPTYMIPHAFPSEKPDREMRRGKTFIEILAMPEFKEQYDFHSVKLPDGRYFNYYKRKDGI